MGTAFQEGLSSGKSAQPAVVRAIKGSGVERGHGGRTRLAGQAEPGQTGRGGPDLDFILSAMGISAAPGHDLILANSTGSEMTMVTQKHGCKGRGGPFCAVFTVHFPLLLLIPLISGCTAVFYNYPHHQCIQPRKRVLCFPSSVKASL